MTILLDSGAFIALERNDRAMWRRLKGAVLRDQSMVTHGGVIAQVWRGGAGRQALLARAVKSIDVVGLDESLAKRTGMLLARSGSSDVVDGAIVTLATHGDQILTSDGGDIAMLVEVSGFRIDVVPV